MSETEHTVSIGEVDGKPLIGVTFTTDPMPGWVILVNLLAVAALTIVVGTIVENRRWRKSHRFPRPETLWPSIDTVEMDNEYRRSTGQEPP